MGEKKIFFVHAQGIKTVHAEAGGRVKKWLNFVHVVFERPLFASHLGRLTQMIESYIQGFNGVIRYLAFVIS